MRLGLAQLAQAQDSLVTSVGRSDRAASINTVSVSRAPLPSTLPRDLAACASRCPSTMAHQGPCHRIIMCTERVGANPANATSARYARYVRDAANVSR
jgi:hypothetical protein